MPAPVSLFGVRLPQTTKFLLKERLRRLKRTGGKHTLYFHYSEFLLRANRNPWYKETLNRATLSAVDGKGLHWAMWSVMRQAPVPTLYSYFLDTPLPLRLVAFGMLFPLQLLINLVSGFWTLLLKFNYTTRTQNEVILGRDFIYDLLRIASDKEWKTLIISGSRQSDELTHRFLTELYPNLKLQLWTRDSNSLLMRDRVLPEYERQTLNSENVCQFFPDLYEAKQFIKEHSPDMILVCLGGASGRQEFFVDHLYQDPEVRFVLASGLGAAVDHFGGGAQQTVAPDWMIKAGLEWLHRFLNQPYRRGRIWDSIFTLYWWTTVHQFQSLGRARSTVVNLVHNQDKEVLLVKRRNILPGDLGWTFVQGGVERKEKVESAGLREIVEEAKLPAHDLHVYHKAQYSETEEYATSLLRFVAQGCRYRAAKKFLNFVEYQGTEHPRNNWENKEASWFNARNVHPTLSVEKRADWLRGLRVIREYQAQMETEDEDT